jgi:hypothetical protein
MGYKTSSNNISLNTPITSTATSYVALITDYTIEVTSTASPSTITLPAPASSGATNNTGKIYIIKDTSGGAATNNITISPASGTIDGAASAILAQNYAAILVYSDGSAWYSQATNFSSGSNTATLNIQTFSASGTYTPSANMLYAIVEIVGGGGGGGGSNATNNAQGGAGGGSGGYAKFKVTSSQVGASQTITIGNGGAGSTTTGSTGTASSFGSLATCNGGSGGASGSSNGAVATATGGAGGTVTITTGSPIFTMTGQKGGNFYGAAAPTLGSVNLGGGGSNPLGFGASAKSISNSTPNSQFTADASVGFGAGGGGSGTVSQSGAGTGSATGGSGLSGYCSVTEFIFAPPPLTTTASITWNTVPGTSQTMAASNGYYTTNVSTTTLTLPTSGCAAGTMMAVIGTGTGLWTIAQNAGQSIQFASQVTTTGTGGSLVASAQGNAVWLLCTVANTTWYVTQSIGNITVN